MRAHFVVNVHRSDAVHCARKTAEAIAKEGWTITVEEEMSGTTKIPSGSMEGADLAVAFGGDGTLIRAAHLVGDGATPILGVYFGRFGFVTQATGENAVPTILSFGRGEAKVEERIMLRATLVRSGHPVAQLHALNEVTLQRSVTARMMHFSVTVDDVFVTQYPADGILVSSPTGSTAYNLSAGGPILQPQVRAIALTAIAPHTLGARTLILHENSVIRLTVETHGDAVLSSDGQTKMHLLARDELVIGKSPRVTHLVTVNGDDFLDKLGRRLLWSRGLTEEDR